jgi:predicted GIY-YIG superfamily endonuclease
LAIGTDEKVAFRGRESLQHPWLREEVVARFCDLFERRTIPDGHRLRRLPANEIPPPFTPTETLRSHGNAGHDGRRSKMDDVSTPPLLAVRISRRHCQILAARVIVIGEDRAVARAENVEGDPSLGSSTLSTPLSGAGVTVRADPARVSRRTQQASERSRLEVHVPVPKTKPTAVSAESHISAIANEEQRKDARTLVALLRRVTRQEPKMWGPGIGEFGSYHYRYASGHEGDSALAAFAVRGRESVLYTAADFEGRDLLLARLGKHKTGKVCVYIRRLANVDLKVLETLVVRSAAFSRVRTDKSVCPPRFIVLAGVRTE